MPAPTAAPPAGLVGRSPALLLLLEQLERVAATPRSTVLIQGPSGSGKELAARALHRASARRAGPFVALNCAALTEPLLEAELFGYEPGAFTGGAPKGRSGLVAAAEGGTLLLDEVAELAPALQAKLLRVLQERVYRPVGATADRPMDVRVVASTHRDLGLQVERGLFREDLYYRLNVLCVRVPALRERLDDVPLLAAALAREVAGELGRTAPELSPAALQRLRAHPWPGNVRELRNALERAVLLAGAGRIAPEHLGLEPPAAGPPPALPHAVPRGTPTAPEGDVLPLGDRSLRAVEEALIRRVLAETGGNKSASARILGIHRATLHAKLREYGL